MLQAPAEILSCSYGAQLGLEQPEGDKMSAQRLYTEWSLCGENLRSFNSSFDLTEEVVLEDILKADILKRTQIFEHSAVYFQGSVVGWAVL